MKSRSKVLHVVESFGGGVATAIAQYVHATPNIEHHLLRSEREGDFVDSGELALFASVAELPKNLIAAHKTIRRVVKTVQPSVVHAHSSFAGAYVRTSIRNQKSRPIVYTPHGYSFERADISALSRVVYRFLETVLSQNTSVIAACSAREVSLSQFMGYRGRTAFVPNVAQPLSWETNMTSGRKADTGFSVVSVGRLTPARDPHFFAEVVRHTKKADPEINFTWVGGGESAYGDLLQELGVGVTGWLPRDAARAILDGAHLHVHTAAWDGFPMVLLEANASRVPSLVRDIAPFSMMPEALRSSTPEQMAQRIVAMKRLENRKAVLGLWDRFLSENTAETQSERLLATYQLDAREHQGQKSPVR